MELYEVLVIFKNHEENHHKFVGKLHSILNAGLVIGNEAIINEYEAIINEYGISEGYVLSKIKKIIKMYNLPMVKSITVTKCEKEVTKLIPCGLGSRICG